MRARQLPFVAIAITAALVIAIVAGGAGGAPAALIDRGASWGPRTLAGEPWRVLTSALVHLGWVQLATNAAIVVGAGAALERLGGRAAVAMGFGAGAAIGTAAGTVDAPYAVIAGASNGALGIAGALAVVLARRWRGLPRARWAIAAGLAAIAAGAIGLAIARRDVTHVGHAAGVLAGAALAAIGGAGRARAGIGGAGGARAGRWSRGRGAAALVAAAGALVAIVLAGRPAPRDPHAATRAIDRIERRFDALVGPATAPAARAPALIEALEREVVAPLTALAAPDPSCARMPRALAAACARRVAYAGARLAAIRAFVAYLRTGDRARRAEVEAATRDADAILAGGSLP